MQITKFPSYKQYLLGKKSNRNVKKSHTDQSIQQFPYSLQNERTHEPSKVAPAKNFFIFSIVYVIDITCFDKCFLFHVINGRHCFFVKIYHYPKSFLNLHIVAFLETSVLKEVCSLNYLHNNSLILIPNELIIFLLRLKTVLQFFIPVFLKKLKPHVFLQICV